jgi:small subunit ribosomal protein S1
METNVIPTESAEQSGLAEIKRKTQFTGKVIKTTLAGAVVDVGLEVPGVIHISQLQEQPTNRVEDVVKIGQSVEVWVKRVDAKKGRIDLTMIKPLDLEWRELAKGMNIKGKVTRLEKFGAFVDIGAERPGLVHISEMTHDYIKAPGDVVKEGDEVNVQVLDVNRRKKQIKLSMKALEEKPDPIAKTAQQFKDKDKEKEKERKDKVEEAEKEEPVPTAMEMALREAMERTKGKDPVTKDRGKRKSAGGKDEIEDMLARTLQHKVRTGR